MRLSLLCGRLDWENLLQTLTPEQFDEWIAYLAVEGDPFIRVVEVLKLGLCATASAFGGKLGLEHLDPWHETQPAGEAATAGDLDAIGLG